MEQTINYNDEVNLAFNDFLAGFVEHGVGEENELILIVNEDYNVSFVNTNDLFWNNVTNINLLNSDPELCSILDVFSKNKINYLSLEITLDKASEGFSEYKVDVTKISIGEELFYLLVFENLNKKIKIERKINNLTYALDYGEIPVIIADNNFQIIYSSMSFERILGLDIEDLFRAEVTDILSKYFSVHEIGMLKTQLNMHGVWKKTAVLNDDGQIKYYEFKILTIRYQEQGAFSYILTANDITDYILMHQEIRRSEGWLKAIINNINELLVVFTKEEGVFLVKNANQNFMSFISMDKIEGLGIGDILPAKYSEELITQITKLDNMNTNLVKYESNLGNEKKYYEGSGTLMLDPVDNKRYYIFTFSDISERITYERYLESAYKEELKLNQLKNDFIANMSHEIRTPANAIIGYSDILMEASQDEDLDTIKEISSSLKNATYRMVKLFDNIMEVSESDSKELKLDLVKINLNQIIEKIGEQFIPAANQKSINLITNLSSNPVYIEADWVKIHKIFEALADNAVKYTDSGRIILKTYTENENSIAEISDTGSGIELNKIKDLVQPFQQGESGYTRNFQGAGLGLTLAYRLTTLLNGKLHFYNNGSKGTVVKLVFPQLKEK